MQTKKKHLRDFAGALSHVAPSDEFDGGRKIPQIRRLEIVVSDVTTSKRRAVALVNVRAVRRGNSLYVPGFEVPGGES